MYPAWFPSINRLLSWQTFSRVDVDLREYFWSPGCFVSYLQILAHHKAVLRNISDIARRKRPKITCLNQTKRIRFKQLNLPYPWYRITIIHSAAPKKHSIDLLTFLKICKFVRPKKVAGPPRNHRLCTFNRILQPTTYRRHRYDPIYIF